MPIPPIPAAVLSFAAVGSAGARFFGTCFTGVPHEAQNFTPADKGSPHFEHLAMFFSPKNGAWHHKINLLMVSITVL
jgi:hypothetical protein